MFAESLGERAQLAQMRRGRQACMSAPVTGFKLKMKWTEKMTCPLPLPLHTAAGVCTAAGDHLPIPPDRAPPDFCHPRLAAVLL
eukprot:1160957-Pelagomonas_calceolata.AAC.2